MILSDLPYLWEEHVAHMYNPDCCINATFVALKVCEHYGIEARPAFGTVMAFNRRGWRAYREGKTEEQWHPSAWSVGCMVAPPTDAKDPGGHMWLVAEDSIVDLSARQMNRPEKGIHVAPLVLPLADVDQLIRYQNDPDNYAAVWRLSLSAFVVYYEPSVESLPVPVPWERDPIPGGYTMRSNKMAVEAMIEGAEALGNFD